MTLPFELLRAELLAAVEFTEPGVPAADELCRACVGLLDMDGAAVSLIDAGTSRGTFGSSGALGLRLDEYQFTFGEGPCLEAAARRTAVLVPDLDSPHEHRWPAFAEAVLGHGIRGVFAMPIMLSSGCVGALDLFRSAPGPLVGDELAAAALAAHLAGNALADVVAADRTDPEQDEHHRTLRMDRIEVYQATGILISQLGVDADAALLRLRAHAIATNQTASEVAWSIIEGRLVLPRDDTHGTGGSQR